MFLNTPLYHQPPLLSTPPPPSAALRSPLIFSPPQRKVVGLVCAPAPPTTSTPTTTVNIQPRCHPPGASRTSPLLEMPKQQYCYERNNTSPTTVGIEQQTVSRLGNGNISLVRSAAMPKAGRVTFLRAFALAYPSGNLSAFGTAYRQCNLLCD